MTEPEFINDPNVREETRQMRQRCSQRGHPPYITGGQGGDDKIYGCYCWWVKLENPVRPPDGPKWKDLPDAVFTRGF